MQERGRSILIDGRALVLVVVLGGLFVLQGSNDLDAVKIVYLLCAAAAVALALFSVPWWLAETRSTVARPWLVFAGAAVAMLILSLAVSSAHGTPFASWLRDAAAYALLAATPILALACARVASRRWLLSVLAVCGALASVSFAVEWIGRRDLAHLPLDRIALPSETLAAALLAVATGVALAVARRSLWWAAIGGAVLGLFFITGSRATLLLLVVPPGMALLGRRTWRSAAAVILTEVVIAIAIFFAGESVLSTANSGPSISLWPIAGSNVLGQRASGVGTLLTNPAADPSFQERLRQTRLAWDTFTTSPLLGVGAGYEFRWTDTADRKVVASTLDTPLVYLAKFGILGLMLLALFVVAYLKLTFDLWRRRQAAAMEFLALAGFALVLLVLGLQYFPIEDKGASFALILVLAIGLRGLPGARAADPAGASTP
jgi:hypothetical protein